VFDFGRPVKFTGLMARQTFSPKFEGYAILANGWDVDSDNNRAKTGALYGIWSPWPIAHFGLGVSTGREGRRTGDRRTTGVATILVQQTDSWVWGEELCTEASPFRAGRRHGEVVRRHVLHAPPAGQTLGAHAARRLLRRHGRFPHGHRQVLRSFTLSPQYLVGGGFFGLYRTLDRTSLRIPEVAVRLDLRYDRSTEHVFASETDEPSRDNKSATLQVVYVF
jgi:hypothetical protein